MLTEEKFSYLDFDIYSRRISFFYQSKEKIGSVFGFILTILYAITSLILFLIYFIRTIKRTDMTASDSTIYPIDIPKIGINKELFYFAFGLEHPTTFQRFIDERIYYPEVVYIERIKESGGFSKRSETALKLERCNKLKFGEKYQYLLKNEELNNSYCLQDFNLTLSGGFKYDEMAYIKISIYPCVNNSKNNIHCKSQEEINKYLNSGYFSALIKDIGLNPSNFTNPTVAIFQDLYTTIDKSTKKEYILNFGITEIETDIGLFSNKMKRETHLKFSKDISNIFFINNEDYKEGKEIFTAQIRLEDNIHIQKRTYTKMSFIFSIIGGYMQLIYTILTLISLLTKKFSVEKKLLNSLFNFNIKQRKIILSVRYKKKLGYNSSSFGKENENNFIPYEAKKSVVFNKMNRGRRNSIFLFNRNNNNVYPNIWKKNETEIISVKKNEKSNSYNVSEEGLIDIFRNLPNDKNQNEFINKINNINRSKLDMLNNSNLNNIYNNNKFLEQRRAFTKNYNFTMINKLENYERGNSAFVQFNICDYFCFRKITKKKTEIELFNFGINFYKSQMDIINFFNIIILAQIILSQKSEKKHDILNQTIELSMR